MGISDYIGIEYDHPRVNCWTISYEILKNVYNRIPPQYHYDGDVMTADEVFVAKFPEWTKVDEPRAGDVVVFNIGNKPLHCGVVCSTTEFIHCLRGRQTCIERLKSIQWHKRINGFYRCPA